MNYYAATDPGFSGGGGMNDKKLEPSLHWGEDFEEGVSPSSLLGGVWGGLSPPQKIFAFFTSKSRILSHTYVCKFVNISYNSWWPE